MFTVVTHTHFEPSRKAEVLDFSTQAVAIAKRQPGFRSIRVHLASDESHCMTYWEWDSEDDHLACMASPDWNEANKTWGALLESGEVRFELATYSVVTQ